MDNNIELLPSEKEILKLFMTHQKGIEIANYNNQGEVAGKFGGIFDLIASYKSAGIQMWHHSYYERYKCRGPYIKEWADRGGRVASWHPSALGQELRGAHYVYFWLLIFQDALSHILTLLKNGNNQQSIESSLDVVNKHIHTFYKKFPIPKSPIIATNFTDNIQCLTSYEPRADPKTHLMDYVVVSEDENAAIEVGKEAVKKPFVREILEDLYDVTVCEQARVKNMKDYKYMLLGTNASTSLSLKLNVKQVGHVFICEPPKFSSWIESGLYNIHFWNTNVKFYITRDVVSDSIPTLNMALSDSEKKVKPFVFKKDNAHILEFIAINPKAYQPMCAMSTEVITKGTHVLTIIPPTDDNKVMFSYLLVP